MADMRFDPPVRTGHILHDPVARSIYNEGLADAMPPMVTCEDCGAEHNDDIPCPECDR